MERGSSVRVVVALCACGHSVVNKFTALPFLKEGFKKEISAKSKIEKPLRVGYTQTIFLRHLPCFPRTNASIKLYLGILYNPSISFY